MFEAENLDKSQEYIGETIGGFNDWLHEKEFGEDLYQSKTIPKPKEKSLQKQKSRLNRKRKNNQRNSGRNMRQDYKKNFDFDGRSFGNIKIVDNEQTKSESVSVPHYAQMGKMREDQTNRDMSGSTTNLIPMKMNNNNLKVNTYKNILKIQMKKKTLALKCMQIS